MTLNGARVTRDGAEQKNTPAMQCFAGAFD